MKYYGSFNIGDVVTLTVDHPDDNSDLVIGDMGTIVDIDTDDRLGIEWSYEIDDGHDCNGNCEYGYGWYVMDEAVTLAYDTNTDILQSDQDILVLLT